MFTICSATIIACGACAELDEASLPCTFGNSFQLTMTWCPLAVAEWIANLLLISSMFPEKLVFDENGFRTIRING